jgi:hypothetical protein
MLKLLDWSLEIADQYLERHDVSILRVEKRFAEARGRAIQ